MRIVDEVLSGAGRNKNATGQGLFTPCAVVDSLLITRLAAAKFAGADDSRDLLSPACFSFDQHRRPSDLAEHHLSVEILTAENFLRKNFSVRNQQNQPTTNTSKKGRDKR